MTELAHKTSEALLIYLKKQGATTSQALAEHFELTNMGARQQLLRLAQQNLVESISQKGQVGRPKQLWQLTKLGQQRFPDRHAEISVQLIDSVRSHFGEQGLQKIIAEREQQILTQYQQALAQCQTVHEKVEQLVQLRTQEGYMAVYQQLDSNRFSFTEHHCPICSAAKCCQGFCRSELEIFQQCFAPDYHVERTEYLLKGESRCSYLIKPKSDKS